MANVNVRSLSEIASTLEEERLTEEEINEAVRGDKEVIYDPLYAHIMKSFQTNRDARRSSGIEEEMFKCLRAVNSHYDPEDLARIQEDGGSSVYMSVTSNKCSTLAAWLKSIFLAQPAGDRIFEINPTPEPDLPADITEKIESEIEKTIAKISEQPEDPNEEKLVSATQAIRDTNQMRQDIEEAFADEIYKIAKREMQKYERKIDDDFTEGNFDEALSNFIDDLSIFPVAYMKGPVITKKPGLEWINGVATPTEKIVYWNSNVSPFYMYPSPNATEICDGDLIEFFKLDIQKLADLRGTRDQSGKLVYNEENIKKLLDEGPGGDFLEVYLENEKYVEEHRGDIFRVTNTEYQALHFFGALPYHLLESWGLPQSELGTDRYKVFQSEAIIVQGKVIKCVLNKDPKLRRPYYKASMKNIPGSWYGESVPKLMRASQRMCNAVVRALSNNLGFSSGPMSWVNVDRLAGDAEVPAMEPLQQYQVTESPHGGQAKPVEFFQAKSNGEELLAIYAKFEEIADATTGIPKYAHGGTGSGAENTATGLVSLLEQVSKVMRGVAENIDTGLIIPRVDRQFYEILIREPNTNFSGDINIDTMGSKTLANKGARELRRNEFLQVMANQTYQAIIGPEGIADILRESAKGLGFPGNVIPSRLDVKRKMKEDEERRQQELEMQSQKQEVGVQQVAMQVEGAERASQRSAEIKIAELELKKQDKAQDTQLELLKLQAKQEAELQKTNALLQKQQMVEEGKSSSDNKNIALSIKSNHQDKSNKE